MLSGNPRFFYNIETVANPAEIDLLPGPIIPVNDKCIEKIKAYIAGGKN